MTCFADIETPLDPTLDPRVYVEPRDKDPASENDRQDVFVATMRRLAKSCQVYAVPNGTHIASRAGRAKVQREGLRKGWPDVGVVWADGEARIEFKNGTKGPEADQIEVLNWLVARGKLVAVCRTAEGAMRWLRDVCHAPVPAIR